MVSAALAVPESMAPTGSLVDSEATERSAVVLASVPLGAARTAGAPLVGPRGAGASRVLDRPERIREMALRVWEETAAQPTSSPPTHRPHQRRPYEVSSATTLKLLESAALLRRNGEGLQAAGVTHTRYRMTKQGLPVFNVSGVLSEREGALLSRAGRIQFPPLSARPSSLDKSAAIAAAMRAAGIQETRGLPSAERGRFALPGETAPAWKVVIPAQRPFGSWQVIVDGRSGGALSLVDLVLNVTGVGSVYDPNVALSPTPSDVPLLRLDGSGRLQGDIVRVFDDRTPAAFSPSFQFRFPAADPRFAQTAVYRGVTDTGIFAENNGFPAFTKSLVAYTNLTDPLGDGEYNNAFYDPFYQLLGFGNGDGVLTSNLGTDFDVASHETGHHLFEVLVQPEIFSELDPIVAMHEGVADTVAALVTGDPNIGESTIPGQPYLRSLLAPASFPDLIGGEPHAAGLVYGGSNWQIVQLLGGTGGGGVEAFTELLFAALAQLPPEAYEFDYRDAMLQANLDVRGGANQTAIESIFSGRGFDSAEFPPEFEGVIEAGVPEARFLANSPNDPDPNNWNYDLFIFNEYPGSTNVTINTTGTGDADLLVLPIDNDSAPSATAENLGSNEQIVLSPASSPSVHDGDAWAIFVFDYPDSSSSSYTLTVTQTLPPADIFVDGSPVQRSIAVPGGFELFSFQTSSPNQVVRLEVEALDATLDPLVAILDPNSFEVFGVDDDSGPGFDAEIQGALLPNVGKYTIVVVSLTADVDPTIGTGAFEIRLSNCDNGAGPDSDGDGLVDGCDDDDDDDTFVDSLDSARLDAALCADFDFDGCDDCASAGFDPFDDGLDSDNDALCNLGDPDDDNDGCEDGVDTAPLLPSADDDFDFLGLDCDNCPSLANGDQADSDVDDVGDSCDNCTYRANSDQEDANDDGMGDSCQCADMNGDGFVNGADLTLYKRFFGGLTSPFSVDRCGVSPAPDGGACNGADLTIIKRHFGGLSPGLANTCSAYMGP